LQDLESSYSAQKRKRRFLQESSKKIEAHRASINVQVSQFPLTAFLDFRPGYGPEWKFNGFIDDGDQIPFGLTTSVALAVTLSARGTLWRLSKCAHCCKWFFARRGGAKYCPGPNQCRVKAYQSRPEHKAQHAADERERCRKLKAKKAKRTGAKKLRKR
jgi:hypothetical protein